MIAKNIMTKGLLTIELQATMQEAHNIMVKSNIRHLLVHDGKTIVGIVSDRDVQRAMSVIQTYENTKEIHLSQIKIVSDYMTTPVLKINQNKEVKEIIKEMVRLKLSCFLVLDDNLNNVGIITTEDLLLALTDLLDSQTTLLHKLKRILAPPNQKNLKNHLRY